MRELDAAISALLERTYFSAGTRVAGAMAELDWEAHHVAVFRSNQEDDAAAFAQAGWQTFDLDQIEVILELPVDSPGR